MDLKEEALTSLRREMEELSFGGGTEEEIAQLKRAKLDAERQCKEQEEELDDMAGQIQVSLAQISFVLLAGNVSLIEITYYITFSYLNKQSYASK